MAVCQSTITRAAWRALFASTVGFALDGFDLLILGFMLHAIAASLDLSAGQAASLVTATLIGAVLGGMLLGLLADRFGRVRVLSWSIALFAVATAGCAFCSSYGSLLVCRLVAGAGLGGEFGIGMALVAETWPAAMRARASSYVGLGWQCGVLAAALLTPVLLPAVGWRGVFLIGLLPALFAVIIRRTAHEPVQFAPSRRPAPTAALRALVQDRASIKISLGLFILCSVQNFGYYGVMIWLPNDLAAQFGFGLTKSALWTAATIIGMGIGIYAFGSLADRFGRRPTCAFYMIGAAIMVVVYAHLSQPGTLLVGGVVMGFFVNGMIGGYGALISELYPTAARATAQNVLFNLGRGVAGFAPVVMAMIAARHGPGMAIAVLSVLYILDLVALLTLIPERRGAALAG